MKLRDKLKLSIQARFSLATALSVASFVIIALILLAAFVQVRTNISRVVGTQLQQTVDHSRQARELGQFLARLQLLRATFYGNDEYLQQEGTQLLQMLEHQGHDHTDSALLKSHLPLLHKLDEYLRQCQTVNELLRWRSWQDEGFSETFDILNEILAERIAAAVFRGEPTSSYEKLVRQIVGYRVKQLEIIQQGLLQTPKTLFAANVNDPPANYAQIASLMKQMMTLAVAEPPLDRFGRHLINQLEYYQHLSTRYQQEMTHLGLRTDELNQLTQQLLQQMEAIDQQHAGVAQWAEQEVDRTILTSGAVVLAMLVILALLLGLIHLNLFLQHIKRPMETLRQRLLLFRQGDYSSPISLNRSDEWGQIEEVFDGMLAGLVESWSALQESERRYRNIFDSASEGIFQSSVDGAFLNINPALAAMFGISTEDKLETFNNLREMIYVNPDDRDRLIDRLQVEETVDNYEVRMRRRSGEIFWTSINCHLVRDGDGQVQFVEGTIDDISQRRKAEDSLRKLKEYLSDIVDAMPSILIGVSNELTVTLWNRQAKEIGGVASSQVLGQPLVDVLSLLEPDHYLETVRETIRTGEISRLRKVPGETADALRFFDLLIYPLKTPNVGGAVIHMDDVTEKVQIEEVMVQSEKMLSVGSLAAGMAHEINNPLASVLQNVQVLSQRLSPALDKNRQVAEKLGISVEQVAEYARLRGFDQMMKSITTSGQRAARIIENMLNFSRKSSSSFIPCSLTDLLEKTLELAASDYDMKHHFDFRTIKVIREYQPVPDVPCESSQIQQVVLNLLKNAAQAIGNKAEQPEIRIRIFSQTDHVCLQIEDNGAGIDETTCKRIFEPFYTTKEVGVGTGLGLSVSYFLITENHKGSLTVTSEVGRGSCFSVLLPLER